MEIRNEADVILYELNLLQSLEKYGTPYPVGSYLADVMAWEDIDISIDCDNPEPEVLYALSAEINNLLHPYFYEARVHGNGTMFYSCETKVAGRRWNLDIWFRDSNSIARTLEYCSEIKRRTEDEPEKKALIIAIKQGLVAHGMYGIDKDPHYHYHSRDVYRAVLEDGITSLEQFLRTYPIIEE